MPVRLSIGDAVLVCINNNNNDSNKNDEDDPLNNMQIGVIQYIGYIHANEMTEYVGIELVEPVDDGHKGTINGYQYFDCPEGYGIHTKITNVIQKLKASEVTIKMQQIITLFKTRLDEYVQAVSERDEYIEKLKNKQRYLRCLLNESQGSNEYISSSEQIKSIKPDPICIDNQMKVSDVDKNKGPTYRVVSPITTITSTESPCSASKPILSGSVIYNNSNTTASTIIFRNIDKKTCTLKVNDVTSNKTIPSFQPTKLISPKSVENTSKNNNASSPQIEDKLNTFPDAEIMEAYHVDNIKDTDQCIDDTLSIFHETETIKPCTNEPKYANKYTSSSDEHSTKTECSDNEEDDDDINIYSSSRKMLTLQTPPLPPLHRYIPPNPPTQQYAYSHMTHQEVERHHGNMDSMKHIGIPSHQSLGVPILKMSYSNPPPNHHQKMNSKKQDHYNGQSQIKFVKSAPDLMDDQKQSASWKIIGGKHGLTGNHQYSQQQNLWVSTGNISSQRMVYSMPNNNPYLAVNSNNNPYYHQPQIDDWMPEQTHVQQNKYYKN